MLATYDYGNQSFILYEATIDSGKSSTELLGYRAIIYSGDTATDFLVATNEQGDKLDASSLLYWYAICDAKNSNIKYFDLGGMGNETPKGIYHFKKGLSPEIYELLGEWQYYFGVMPKLFKCFNIVSLYFKSLINRL
jgi:lipid II:glycine glycyltransferase (peptidoglycan interpeptide bridge formation enzyme)